MKPLRAATPRHLRRATYLTVASAAGASTLVMGVPSAGASGSSPIFTQGNLLVSTGQYSDVPNITAGSTVLPIQNVVAITGVTTSGSAPNIVATISTGTTKTGLTAGQTVTIQNVGGATQVNGSWTVASVKTTSPYSFTINLGSTAVSSYTSGGTEYGVVVAVAGGQYPYVFNNAAADGNFGITEPIVLDQIPATTSLVSSPISQFTVPNSDTVAPGSDQLVTSFSSKSELALNQSTDTNYVTFMGYNAPTAAIDVSNSNTPNEQDPTNSDVAGPQPLQGYYRDAATMDSNGNIQYTETGAYGGNNGRAAVLNSANNTLFMVGNAGNGGNPAYQGVVIGAGSQLTPEATTSQASQDASMTAPTAYGNFNITQVGDAPDKATKDNNYRGLDLYNGVIYMTKGSGGNGINTVYFVDTTGNACPSGGVGVPQSGASLPSTSSWTAGSLYPQFYNGSTANSLGEKTSNPGLTPANMCILKGFPTTLASSSSGVSYPFGLWFANPTTLYVADEGSGAGGAGDTTGGLQKWSFNSSTNTWVLDYTLQNGLNLQTPYSVNPSNPSANINGSPTSQSYPTGVNNTQGGKGGNWAPATDGLRNIVGRINGDGTVTIWATTSTISGSGDQGADPNQVVAVTDSLAATSLPSTESFSQVMAPTDGVVYRGVSFTPTTPVPDTLPEVPWVPLIPLAGITVIGGGYILVRRRAAALQP